MLQSLFLIGETHRYTENDEMIVELRNKNCDNTYEYIHESANDGDYRTNEQSNQTPFCYLHHNPHCHYHHSRTQHTNNFEKHRKYNVDADDDDHDDDGNGDWGHRKGCTSPLSACHHNEVHLNGASDRCDTAGEQIIALSERAKFNIQANDHYGDNGIQEKELVVNANKILQMGNQNKLTVKPLKECCTHCECPFDTFRFPPKDVYDDGASGATKGQTSTEIEPINSCKQVKLSSNQCNYGEGGCKFLDMPTYRHQWRNE